VHVDPGCSGCPDDPGHVGAAAGDLLPPAAVGGSDYDLGDLMAASELGNRGRGIVAGDFVPASAQVLRERPNSTALFPVVSGST
jgi:hypothetical protein